MVRFRRRSRYGNHLDGIFLDDVTYTFGKIGNYRRSLWVYSGVPLTFSYNTRKVVLYDAFSTGEFCSSLRNYLHGKGLPLAGSINSASYTWYAPSFDVIGGELPGGAEPTCAAYIRRTLSYGKPWSNLFVPYSGQGAPTASQVLAFFRQALLLGYFPGFNGTYWSDSTAYERDRPLFKQYMPLIRKIVAAGWKPVNYATPSDPAIYVERFDDQKSNTFYLTAQNSVDHDDQDLPDDRRRRLAAARLGHHHRQGARRQHHPLRLSFRLQHPLLRYPRRGRNRSLPNHRSRRISSSAGLPAERELRDGPHVTDGLDAGDERVLGELVLGCDDRCGWDTQCQTGGARDHPSLQSGSEVRELPVGRRSGAHTFGLDEEFGCGREVRTGGLRG